MKHVLVVSYHDGSAVKGVYGPYDGPESAREAMKQLKALPGMAEDEWKAYPLHEVSTGSNGTGQEATP